MKRAGFLAAIASAPVAVPLLAKMAAAPELHPAVAAVSLGIASLQFSFASLERAMIEATYVLGPDGGRYRALPRFDE